MLRSIACGIIAVGAAFLGSPRWAAADSVLFTQPFDGSGDALASQNAVGGLGNFATAYDSFTLTTTNSVNTVAWVGEYFDGSPGTITSWTVSFYGDNAGVPGGLLASYSIGGNGNETFLSDFGGHPGYTYSETIPGFAATGGTKYWLSVVPSMGYPPQWGWATAGPGVSYQVFEGSGSLIDPCLAVTLLNGPSAVPLPSSLALLASIGLPAFVYGTIRRRRKQTAA